MRRFFLTPFSLLALASVAHSSPYFELGTGLAKFSSGDALTEQSIGDTSLGFVGSLNFYVPVTSLKSPIHLDLGLQNRFTMVSGSLASPSVFTPNVAMRIEFWRFFVGGGYSPKVFVDMRPQQGAYTYFGEAGLIWRVIPEFQICASLTMEYGKPAPGGTSPSPSTEYGLRMRFPLDPKEMAGGGGVDFDGYRYPFGIMR